MSLHDVAKYFRDGTFSNDIAIVNLHTSEGTHWVAYKNENYYDSYGFSPPQRLSKFIIKRIEHCFYFEYKIQDLTNERDSYYASYCFYIGYLTKIIGIDFKPAVLSLYYQMIQ